MSRRRPLLLAVTLAGLLGSGAVAGYEPQVHQRLTFFAAKVLNRCVEGSPVAPLTPLQVRFIANGNMGLASSNALIRFFRWSYFDVADRDDRQFLWLISTRFLDDFDAVSERFEANEDAAERYQELGRIVSYVQLVSAPSRALPVYTARFWRWSFGDRFDDYPLDGAALEAALGATDCDFLEPPPESYRDVLFDVARDTLAAVRAPVDGLPTTWESFWTPGRKPGDFGDYGPAGNNFGRKVEFRCLGDPAERCVLLEDDPLYAEFALARQLAAVRGTARVMLLYQRQHGDARVQQADR
ncbi:MAG: hypothetical protein RIC56_08605 [Pseudomonadales bacterium]